MSLTSRCTRLKVMFCHRVVHLLFALVYTGKSRGCFTLGVSKLGILLSVHG